MVICIVHNLDGYLYLYFLQYPDGYLESQARKELENEEKSTKKGKKKRKESGKTNRKL
jgi:hypothetical protein